MRSLSVVANATPKDYLAHIPPNPELLALQMIEKARRLWPYVERGDGVSKEPNYEFLFVGPGAGLIVQTLLDQGHRAYGLETSRRGIASGPEVTRSYIKWSLPWELPFTSLQGEVPTPIKQFHIAIINKYLREVLTADEWQAALKEIKKVSRYVYAI